MTPHSKNDRGVKKQGVKNPPYKGGVLTVPLVLTDPLAREEKERRL